VSEGLDEGDCVLGALLRDVRQTPFSGPFRHNEISLPDDEFGDGLGHNTAFNSRL
jgi:hypothetical protein